MAQPLRWGLLGTAKINQAVIPPLKSSERNHLTGVASRDARRADAYAQEWGIPRSFDSYEAMLADPHIDVVYISLPNSLHAEWAVRALQAGKHVLCEKPLASTLEQADAIIDAARQSGKVIAEAFMYRHHPQTLKVLQMVREGALGKIGMVRGSFTFKLTGASNIRINPDLGGGSIWDIGCYPISYTRAIIGAEPVEVFGSEVRQKGGVDLSFMGQLRFPGNVLAQIQCSFNTPLHASVEIFGDEGHLLIPTPFKPTAHETLYLTRSNTRESIEIESHAHLYAGEVEDLADAILNGKTPRVTLADSRCNLAAILALLDSANSGHPVPLK